MDHHPTTRSRSIGVLLGRMLLLCLLLLQTIVVCGVIVVLPYEGLLVLDHLSPLLSPFDSVGPRDKLFDGT